MFADNIERFDQMLVDKCIPFSVTWELTYRCNHKCIHCYQYPPAEELSLEKIKDIILQLERKGCLYLTFTGGEPLLREDFWQIAEFARQRDFSIDLFSNGTVIDRETAKRISDLSFTSVHISLLGAKDKTHDKIVQVKGSFKKVTQAIAYLKERGVRIILKTPLMKDNFPELEELHLLKKRFSVHHHAISPLIYPKSDGDSAPFSLRLSDDAIDRYYSLSHERSDDVSEERKDENACTQLCYYGRTFCSINPKGEVYPCVAAPVVAGDLRKESFGDIWDRSPILHYLRETRLESLLGCRDCQYTKYCFRCGGLAYLEGEGFRGVSPEACRLAKINNRVSKRRAYEEKEKVQKAENDCAVA